MSSTLATVMSFRSWLWQAKSHLVLTSQSVKPCGHSLPVRAVSSVSDGFAGVHKNNAPQSPDVALSQDMFSRKNWDASTPVTDFSQEEAFKKYVKLVESSMAVKKSSASSSAPTTAQDPGLTVDVQNGIRLIKLNRPDKRNAITIQMYNLLAETLRAANDDDSTNIVVMTGTGDYFSSGNYLGNFASVTAEGCRATLKNFVGSYIDLKKPLIMLVNGPTMGIGVTILGLADVVYASDKATFVAPFSSKGQVPEVCSTYTFPRIMGYAKANEMLLFDAEFTAQQAQASGLVAEVFPHDTFAVETQKRVEAFAKLPVKSLIYSKELIRGRERQLLHDVNEMECDRLVERWLSEDCMNAINKFFSRRKLQSQDV